MTVCDVGTSMSQGYLDQLTSFGCQFQDFLQPYVAISNQVKHDNPTRRTSIRILALLVEHGERGEQVAV